MICSFDYLKDTEWTGGVVGAMSVHQRAVGEHHGLPHILVVLAERQLEEALGERETIQWKVACSMLYDLRVLYSLHTAHGLTLAISTSSEVALRWLIANIWTCTASVTYISFDRYRSFRNLMILASLTSATRSKNQRLMDERKQN